MTNTYKSKFSWAIVLIVAVSLLTTLYSCEKNKEVDYTPKGIVYYEGKADSLQMLPLLPVGSPGTSTFNAFYDNDLHVFNYFVKWQKMTSGVTKVDMFFPNNTVANGLLQRNIFTTTTPRTAVVDSISGAILGTLEFSATDLANLKAGKIYYTITTQSNTTGEIRGQIKVK